MSSMRRAHALKYAADIPGTIASADARISDVKRRLDAVKTAEFTEASERPELNGFLYPEVAEIEAAVEDVAGALAEAEARRRVLPPPASPLFAEITPNMVIKYARAADRAMALLKNAELSVEDELLERNSLETDPTPMSKTRRLEGRPPLADSLANDRVEEDSGLLRRGASFDEDADLDHERSVVAEEEASGRTVFDAVRKVGGAEFWSGDDVCWVR